MFDSAKCQDQNGHEAIEHLTMPVFVLVVSTIAVRNEDDRVDNEEIRGHLVVEIHYNNHNVHIAKTSRLTGIGGPISIQQRRGNLVQKPTEIVH